MRLPIYVLVRHISVAQPRRDRANLTTGVRELDSDFLVLAVREFDDASEWLNLGVFPESVVFARDAPFGGHGRGFDHCEAVPAQNHSAQMGKVPRSVVAIICGILAHG